MTKLTDIKVRSLKSTGKDYSVAGGNGLYVRVSRKGVRTFSYRYKNTQGEDKWMSLGQYPTMSVADAHAARDKIIVQRREGLDPLHQREIAEATERVERERLAAEERQRAARLTGRDLFEDWHKKKVSKLSKAKDIRRLYEKDVLPVIGDLYAQDVRRHHVMQILDRVLARGSNIQANRLLSYIRQTFVYAMKRDQVQLDPTFGLEKRDVGGREVERSRAFAQSEIIELAAKLPVSGLEERTQLAFWVSLSTIARPGEVSRARWCDVDLEGATWTIPPEHSKNGKPHIIHLSSFALEQFKKLEAIKLSDDWVFPSRDGRKHIYPRAFQKQFYDRQQTRRPRGRRTSSSALLLPSGRWTAHDLRRTGATLMGELGIHSDVIEKCLNHTEPNKLKRTYQRQILMRDRQEAFVCLGELLEVLYRGESPKVIRGDFGRAAAAA